MKVNLTTVASRAIAALVAAVAGFASYRHIYDVAAGAGEHQGVAAVLPLAIDGLIVVATLAMLEDKRNRRRPRLSARVALVFGILATLAANVASAEPTATARMVAAIPAISFLLAVEVLARTGKPLPATVTPTVTPAPAVVDTPPAGSLTAIVDATVATPKAATPTPRRPARRTPAKAAKTRQSTAELVATTAAENPAMTQAQVAEKLGLGVRTVQRNWRKPTATVNGHDHALEVIQ